MRSNVSRLVLSLLAFAAPAIGASAELPKQGLEDRIEFWKKVFTQYGKDDVIIHDRIRVHLIYDVATRDEREQKVAAVKQALEEIAANLESPENLGFVAQQVRDSIVTAGAPLTQSSLADLRNNIHTQIGIKERFREGIIRSGRYNDAFREIFEREGIPAEIALLPLVESSYENRARSTAGAAGIWQFTRGTGRLYLTIGRKVDERFDALKATSAAARLLRDNHRVLGSWPLAITAYNHGRGGMLRARNEVGSDITKIIDEYRGRLFGYASMNFYAEFLAAVEVYNDYEQYFGQLVLDRPAVNATPAPTRVAAAKAPPKPAPKPATPDKYRVRKGDTLTHIAQRFGTSVRELMDINNLRNTVIRAGQILVVR